MSFIVFGGVADPLTIGTVTITTLLNVTGTATFASTVVVTTSIASPSYLAGAGSGAQSLATRLTVATAMATLTTPLTIPLGAVGAPSITGVGGTTGGLYFLAAGQPVLTDGSSWMRFGNGLIYFSFDGGTTIAYKAFSQAKLVFSGTTILDWATTDAENGTVDTGLARNAAGIVEINNGTAGTFRDLYVRAVSQAGANGQLATIQHLTELTTIAAAATTDTAIQIPAGAIVLSVNVRVTVAIPTAATFTVIGATSATVFDTAAVTVAANSTDMGTKSCPYYNAAAQAIRFTPDVQPAANTGRVRVSIVYILITPPTS